MSKVSFNYADRRLSLNNKTKIKSFIEVALFTAEGVRLKRLNYIFCSDDYLLSLNKQFLEHDYYTDIITFDLSDGNGVVGEIYVSLDRVKENAQTLQLYIEDEILRVIIHGALHLCGYNDKKKSEQKLMRDTENTYIKIFKQGST